jgi:RNase P/RNase MRP subunit p30
MGYRDIVIPDGNEEELIRMAELLGYSELVMCYKEVPEKKQFKTKLKVCYAVLAQPGKVSKARKAGLVIVKTIEKIRETVEREKPDIIFGMEERPKRDYMHQRNSGMNHIICRIANEKNVAFGLSFTDIRKNRHQQKLLGRIMQNVRLYNKYKCRVVFGTFAASPFDMRGPLDLVSFLATLGLKNPKKAMQNIKIKKSVEEV